MVKLAFHPYRAAMCDHNVLHDGESDAEPAVHAAARAVGLADRGDDTIAPSFTVQPVFALFTNSAG